MALLASASNSEGPGGGGGLLQRCGRLLLPCWLPLPTQGGQEREGNLQRCGRLLWPYWLPLPTQEGGGGKGGRTCSTASVSATQS
eukprot:352308-Chlamydomonas_euryale.AAC.3